MTSRDFAYWLQGFFEINEPSIISDKQTEIIKKHLNLVFKHEIDPIMGDKKHQNELNKIHNPKEFPKTEIEAIVKWGPKPSKTSVFGLHGWFEPGDQDGLVRC